MFRSVTIAKQTKAPVHFLLKKDPNQQQNETLQTPIKTEQTPTAAAPATIATINSAPTPTATIATIKTPGVKIEAGISSTQMAGKSEPQLQSSIDYYDQFLVSKSEETRNSLSQSQEAINLNANIPTVTFGGVTKRIDEITPDDQQKMTDEEFAEFHRIHSAFMGDDI